MIVKVLGEILEYKSDAGDWCAEIVTIPESFSITFISGSGTMSMSSGINYDNLQTFIGQVKTDAISRGVNWSGS